jgi:hypothetical protein
MKAMIMDMCIVSHKTQCFFDLRRRRRRKRGQGFCPQSYTVYTQLCCTPFFCSLKSTTTTGINIDVWSGSFSATLMEEYHACIYRKRIKKCVFVEGDTVNLRTGSYCSICITDGRGVIFCATNSLVVLRVVPSGNLA